MEKERIYLAVPFADRNEAKAAGARWDSARSAWYAHSMTERLARWAQTGTAPTPQRSADPRDSFAATLRDLGCRVAAPHPLPDGVGHRIATAGDKGTRKSGFYVLHSNGIPAGYVINHRTGESQCWKASGLTLSPVERAQLRAQAASQALAQEQARARRQAEAADAAATQLARARVLSPGESTPYLISKGVTAHHGLCTSPDGKSTWIPIHDTDGRIHSLQSIAASGEKRYLKGGRIQGCFHALGGLSPLAHAAKHGVVLVAEGYATAATTLEITEPSEVPAAAVAAFHASNLPHVCQALRRAYPQAKLLLAADDDRRNKVNAGRIYADKAAALSGASVCLPPFGREHPQSLSDWNDLDQHRPSTPEHPQHRDCLRAAVTRVHLAPQAERIHDEKHSATDHQARSATRRPTQQESKTCRSR